MQDLNDLYFFVQVVDHGGYAPAARFLDVQKSMLSRRIQRLEDRLGVRLLNRSSRRFSVTEIGQEFYARCQAMLVEAEAAEMVIAQVQSAPRGVVRVVCPVALLNAQMGKMLTQFMAAYPEVELHLEATNRRVDVIAENFDVALRVRYLPIEPSELVMRKLDVSTQALVASPDLVPAPLESPADIHAFPSLALGGGQGQHMWNLEFAGGRNVTVPHEPRLVTDDMAMLREAALAGLGIVQLPNMLIWEDIAAGRLIHVLPDWSPRAGIIHAVFPSRRGLLPSVRALIDFLANACHARRDASGLGETLE